MPEIDPDVPGAAPTPRRSAAGIVAAGIFSSRIAGFVREATVAYFFGAGAHADVFRAALKGPNVLQNLLGEGTISAAFIPIYSRMLEEGRPDEAGRFAGAIFGLMVAITAALVLIGVALAGPIVTILTPGFVGDAARVAAGELSVNRFELAVRGVRIIFPMAGILVLSAWALAILNSHRRFFVPYVAPVLWNVAIIAALFGAASFGIEVPSASALPPDALTRLLFAGFFGALVGGVLQFAVQLPLVIRLMKGFRLSFSTKVKGVREAVRAFGPVVAGRGVVQLSAYLDTVLASLLAAGALGALGYAQMFYVLPVSLFGMSVAASELPELSRIEAAQHVAFLERVRASLRQIFFLTVPTFVGYLAFGLPLIRALLERGRFGPTDSWLVYAILAAYTLGLLATTASRLLQNAFYALHDTRTPARVAVLRVLVSTTVAVPLMFWLDRFAVAPMTAASPQETPLFFGAVGLALGASVGAWLELWRLRLVLRRRLRFALPVRAVLRMVGLAALATLPAGALWWLVAGLPPIVVGLLVVGVYGLAYLALARLVGLTELEAWTGRLLRRLRKR